MNDDRLASLKRRQSAVDAIHRKLDEQVMGAMAFMEWRAGDDIAERCGLPLLTVHSSLERLSKAGDVQSKQGASGATVWRITQMTRGEAA